MSALLAASLVLLVVGVSLSILGRWRAVGRMESVAVAGRAWSTTMTLGLVVAVLGAVLLVLFVVSGMTMPSDVAA